MRETLERRIQTWIDDPDSSVVYAEELEGRWAVRMRQTVRDATTVWFEIGQRSLWFEAYLLPAPLIETEAFRQALTRNQRGWRVFFALDQDGALVVRGRMAADAVDSEELDRVLGEIYEMVELSFRPMLRAGFPGREISA